LLDDLRSSFCAVSVHDNPNPGSENSQRQSPPRGRKLTFIRIKALSLKTTTRLATRRPCV